MLSRPLQLGANASCQRSFDAEDVEAFAALSGDHNPMHLDESYAARSRFGQRVVHGMLVASLLSGLIANELPGEGTIYLEQSLRFLAPAFLNQQLVAHVEVTQILKPGIYRLSTSVRRATGETVLEGEAVVMNRVGEAQQKGQA